ncbi:hypothetical protein DP49_5956 [Burkholderia pseudomallei]|nr:hypothetical protein DP49_5956 [Burkholderia pseudomallei]
MLTHGSEVDRCRLIGRHVRVNKRWQRPFPYSRLSPQCPRGHIVAWLFYDDRHRKEMALWTVFTR